MNFCTWNLHLGLLGLEGFLAHHSHEVCTRLFSSMTQYPQGTTTSCYSCPPHTNIARITPTLHQQKVYLNIPDYNVGFLKWQWHNLANITDVKSVSMVCFHTQACMNWICVKEEFTPSTAHIYLSEAGHTLNQVMTSNLSRGKSLPEPTMTYLLWPEGTELRGSCIRIQPFFI